MKAFSKEWWLKKGLRFELVTCFKRSIKQQHKLAMFCFKRYAEAYHREKMAFTESPLLTMHKKGQEAEQKRILGIIEKEIGNIDGMNYEEDNYDAGKVHALQELIEKIKR
jgi:hypothetical protein